MNFDMARSSMEVPVVPENICCCW